MTTKILNPETLAKKRKLQALLLAKLNLKDQQSKDYASLVVSGLGWLCKAEENKVNELAYVNLLDLFIKALQ